MTPRLSIVNSLAMLCLAASPAFGQDLSVYNIVTSTFPRITANYVALDEGGKIMDDLTPRDFRVVETTIDGKNQDLTPTLSHTCVTNASSTSASIVLIVDESLSMDQVLPSGKRRIDYVKEALQAFVARLTWNGETAVSIIGFSGKSRLLCDWQTSPNAVLQAIGRLTPLSATNYEVSFLGIPNVFDQMSQRPPSIPKVAFFITDGAPNPDIQKRPEFEAKVVASARAQGIRFFSVTLMINRTDPSIGYICRATGGRSLIASEESLVNLIAVLAFEATSKRVCTISWISPLVCSDPLRTRTATIQLRRGRQPDVKATYTTPDTSLVKIDALPSTLVYADVAPGQSTTASCTITAVNTDVTVSAASISTPAFFQLVNFSPFSLKKGESKTLTIKFTQGAERIIRQGTVTFTGIPTCVPSVTLVAGGGNVVLTSPNGGEVLSTCNETRITWTGVPSYQPVSIEYSCDGTTWDVIADTATGGYYTWHPSVLCETGHIRVRTLAGERFVWANRYGGSGTESVECIDVTPDGSRVIVGGSFVGQTEIGSAIVSSIFGASDGYVTELDNTGAITNTTLLRGDIGTNERIVGISTGADRWSRGALDVQDGVIYKFRPNGALVWRIVLGGTDFVGSTIDISSLLVRSSSSGDIEAVVVGTCQSYISAKGLSGAILDEIDVSDFAPSAFSARITSTGVTSLSAGFDAEQPSKDDPLTATDGSGYYYAADVYKGNYTVPLVPPVTFANKGNTDVWVTKSAIGASLEDVSDRAFRVVQPILRTELREIIFDSTAIGRASTFSSTTALRNIGTALLMIDSVVVSGLHPKDFVVIDRLDSITIDTGGVRSLEISFAPTAIGTRRAIVTVFASCGTVVSFTVVGEGRQDCPWTLIDTIDVGKLVVGSSATKTFDCILKSDRRGTVRGILSVRGSTDFTITPIGVFTLRYGECVNVRVAFKPTVPGIQTAQIDLNLPTECGIAFTQVFGEGITPALSVSNVNFGNHRLGTTSLDTINIVNNGAVDVDVTSLSLVDTTGTGMSAVLPFVPTIIRVGDTLVVPTSFSPATRGAFTARLFVDARGIDSALVGTLQGSGYQPVCEARGYSFAPVLAGTISNEPGYVRVWNTDDSWPLQISDIRMSSVPGDFFFPVVPGPFPIIVGPNDSIDLAVNFSPKGAGLRAVNVEIFHDGRPGPMEFPPYASTSVIVDGVGLQRSVLPPVIMDTILSCLRDTAFVSLVNDDPRSVLSVTGLTSVGDFGAFVCEPPPPFDIPKAGSQLIRITFSPPSPGRFAASFSYTNDRSLDLTINASGVGRSEQIRVFMSGATSASVGIPVAVPIDIDVPSLLPFIPATLTLTITHSASTMRFASFAAGVATGWTFIPQSPTPGVLKLVGTSNGMTPLETGRLVTPLFDTYLTADASLPLRIELETPYTCLEETGDSVSIAMSLVCFAQGRLISISGTSFRLDQPRPSPAGSSIVVPFAIGLSGTAEFTIVDVTGRVVRSLSREALPSGQYELPLDVSELAQGAYQIRLTSGPFVGVSEFLVAR
ncbi:MAG: choice-of-anchor D domain-containing protein [Candidatus Kapabacteria bacterium]|nr:choice-of-anchor D domain-containing protein [Candidatus Kapabacteria bacterium]